MATETIRRCDICACPIGKEDRVAQLVVPTVRSQDAPLTADEQFRRTMVAALFHADESVELRKYDVCVPCCTGLLSLSVEHKAAIDRGGR